MFDGLLEKGKKIAIGGYGTITTPSPVVYAVGHRFNIGGVTRNPPIRQI